MPLLLLLLGLVISTPLPAPASAEAGAEASDAVRERDDRIADLERKLDLVVEELATVRDQVAVPEDRDLKTAYGFGPAASKIYGVDVPAQRKRAADDSLAREKQAYLEERRDPSFVTYGPKTRREFFALRREQGGRPW